MKRKNDENTEEKPSRGGIFAALAGSLLLAAGLFALAAMVIFFSFGRDNDWGWGFVFLGILSFIGWFIGRRQAGKKQGIAGDQHSRQRTVLAVNAIIVVAVAFAALVFLNVIASRHRKVLDLTKNNINSLSDQTQKVLAQLKEPVAMRYLWLPTQESPQMNPYAQSVLEAYKSASSKVRIEYINVAQDQLRFQQLAPGTFNGTQPLLIIEPDTGSKQMPNMSHPARQEVAVTDEGNITSALLKLNDAKPKVLYFLSGHQEAVPSAGANPMGQPSGLDLVSRAMASQNYTIKVLSLLAPNSKIPTDAAAVIAVRPQLDLFPSEERLLKQYMANKGRFILLLSYVRLDLKRWKSLLGSVNLQWLDGGVLERDPDLMVQNQQQMTVRLESARHDLLRGVAAGPIFPGMEPLKVKPAPPGATHAPVVTPLFESSPNSESVVVKGNKIVRVATGPLVLAAAAEKGASRMVVVGNAEFVSDMYFNAYGNNSFFLSALNWVVGNDTLVSIPPKQPVTNTIAMTTAMQRFTVIVSLFTLPLVLLMIGTVVWWKRR